MYEPKIIPIIKNIAKEMDLKLIIESEFNSAGKITFNNGKETYFYNTTFEINNSASAKIAKDKAYTSFFLKNMGYRVPEGQTFFCDNLCRITQSDRNIDKGYIYGEGLGYPFIIKPNDLAMGELVTKIYDKEQYYKVAQQILQRGQVMLIQKIYSGKDYRVVVLDDKVIAVYERVPLSVIGDGKSTIEELMYIKEHYFNLKGRERKINFDDYRTKDSLKRQGLSLDSIIENGTKISLLDNSNLSTGGEATVYTNQTHKDFISLAIKATKDIGLRLCGIDIITQDITKSVDEQDYIILEMNASPSLSNYMSLGEEHYRIVENMYREILYKIQNEKV